ncbi:MAG: N-6 DNA methylase [Acidobacteria bacterium]|nr:N-6 DNA methylase [Acidobacteriota bacterium]
MPDGAEQYLRNIERAFLTGKATEHTYRPALEEWIESLADGIVATNEPKRVNCGAPDFIITRGEIPLGYIEAKDIGEPLDKIEPSEQMRRYLESLGNLILTDYLEFRWYVVGERRLTARLAKVGAKGKLQIEKEGGHQVTELLTAFLNAQAPTVSGPKELAERMAALARLIRDAICRAFEDEDGGGSLHQQMEGFRQVLLHDLTQEQFADMYAQTICYGLFAARCNVKGGKRFTREHAAYDLPKTNPFLSRMFSHIAGPHLDDRIVWAVDDLVELLHRAVISAILRDFGKRTRREDPVVHFYETFLAAYDPTLRETRGVYYTPEPVVSYIVRSVDHILKKDFNLSDGLADASKIKIKAPDGKGKTHVHKVLILDPATGTGTFLQSVIDLIYEHQVTEGQAGAWSGYVSQHLLPRLFGFELLMAPYAVAHMKLGLQLAETGYDFKADERLRVYLTNTLEEAHEMNNLPLFAQWLAEEANAAGKIKQGAPVVVVLGNPPYSGHSANTGRWITNLLRGIDTQTGEKTWNYFEVDGQPLGERNPKWLNDDYVKFIRFAQWRIEKTGYGILAFICNHGYLDNPTFRGLRRSLMETFDDIYVLDLHGSSKKKERCPDGSKDENVFDIQQGVAIGIFVKRGGAKKKAATLRHAHLWGVREVYKKNVQGERELSGGKYHWLLRHDVRKTKWIKLKPPSPFYLFVPQDIALRAEYEQEWKVTEMMPVNVLGFQSHRDHFAIDFDEDCLHARIADLRGTQYTDDELRNRYGLRDNRDWHLADARKQLRGDREWKRWFIRCSYRPFDWRFCYFSAAAMDYPRRELLQHVANRANLCLNTVRQTKMDSWQHAVVADSPAPAVFVELKDGSSVFPLYLYPDGKVPESLFDYFDSRRPNFSSEFVDDFAGRLKMTFIPDGRGTLKKTFGPEDVFNYMYAVFHSPTYRRRYAEFLKVDFPRLPLTSNADLLCALCRLGGELVKLHLMEGHVPLITRYPIAGDNTVEAMRYTEPGQGAEKGRVWINKTQYFEGVPPEVWNFHVGGYQVCQKWLKDRKGRQLIYDDLTHYQRVVAALMETIRLMAEIDEVINGYGGWPIQ